MTPETLRIACERAGGKRDRGWKDPGWAEGWRFDDEFIRDGSIALLPLVAERLRVQCIERDVMRFVEYTLNTQFDANPSCAPELRILAALVALGDLTIEQAREEMET